METIFLTGASSKSGEAVYRKLSANYRFILLKHKRDLNFEPRNTDLVISSSLRNLATFRPQIAEAKFVIHLAALTKSKSPNSYYDVNLHGTEHLLSVCSPKQRLLYVSSKCADANSGAYSHSKALAEERIHQSNLPFLILQPADILDSNPKGGIDMLFSIAKDYHLVINFLCPKSACYRPITSTELAEAIGLLIEKDIFTNSTYSIENPCEYTAKDIMELFRVYSDRNYYLLPIPLKALRLLNQIPLPWPWASDQLERLKDRGSNHHPSVTKVIPFNPAELSCFVDKYLTYK